MAYRDGNKTVYFPVKELEEYPGWIEVDCGCCNGLQWGGEYPTDCYDCKGAGFYFIHKKSKVMAEYPGSRLLGKISNKDFEYFYGSKGKYNGL